MSMKTQAKQREREQKQLFDFHSNLKCKPYHTRWGRRIRVAGRGRLGEAFLDLYKNLTGLPVLLAFVFQRLQNRSPP